MGLRRTLDLEASAHLRLMQELELERQKRLGLRTARQDKRY